MAEADTNAPQQGQQAAPPAAPPQQPAPAVSVDQAKKAAEQLAGGLKQGMEQLQQTGVAGVFKTAEKQPKVTTEEKLWAGLSYIPLVALVALIIKPDSGFVKLHGRQGLLIFLIFFFCIFVYLVPYIGLLFGGLIQFALLVLGLFSMYQAFIGNWWKIPVLGDLAEMIPVGAFTKVTTEVITGQPAPQEPPAGAEKEAAQTEEPIQQAPSDEASQKPLSTDQAPPVNK